MSSAVFHGWLFELVQRAHEAAADKPFATIFADIPQDRKNFNGLISGQWAFRMS